MAEKTHTADVNFKGLTEYILKSYLDSLSEEDMSVLELLDDNLSVIGTGKHEFFRSLQEFSRSFTFETEQRGNVRFEWQNFEAEEQKAGENLVLVCGSVLIPGIFRTATRA